MGRDSLPVALAALFLVVAVVASIVLQPGPGAQVGQEAVDAFLAAWRASRLGTYAIDTHFERSSPDGGRLEAEGRIVQRPPDRLVEQFGGVDGRLDGHLLVCATDPAGAYRCTPGAAAPDYGAKVDEELATLASYFTGAKPLYRVTGDGHGCFRLALALDFPSPPYGTSAQFCFDGETGAPVRTEIVGDDVVDVTTATDVRGSVTAEDLRVPEQPPTAVTTPPG